jgi:hypothetical protein
MSLEERVRQEYQTYVVEAFKVRYRGAKGFKKDYTAFN